MYALNLSLHRRHVWLNYLPWILVSGLIVLSIQQGIHIKSRNDDMAYWQQVLNRKPARIPRQASMAPVLSEEEQHHAEALSRIVHQINAIPLPILDALARITGKDIALDEVVLGGAGKDRPGAVRQQVMANEVSLVIEAKSPEAMYDFWTRLNAHPSFADVQMFDHSRQSRPGYQVEVAHFSLRLSGLPPATSATDKKATSQIPAPSKLTHIKTNKVVK